MKTAELKDLIRFCKELNVRSLKVGTTEIHFLPTFEPINSPLPEDNAKQAAQDYANLMFMSSSN